MLPGKSARNEKKKLFGISAGYFFQYVVKYETMSRDAGKSYQGSGTDMI